MSKSAGPFGTHDWSRVHVGDARTLSTILPPGVALDLTITSPPYWNAVDYGVPGQIGFGQSHDDYLDDMEEVLRTLFDRTAPTGSLWLIVDTLKSPARDGLSRIVPLPFELSERAEAVGWVLHDVAIWRKDRTLPWSSRGRLRNAFEYVLFLVKGPDFKYQLRRIREHESIEGWWKRYPERYSPHGAAPTNVWDFPIPLQGSWSNGLMRHQCPLPRGLVQRIVELCSDPGDVVCDPFCGVGTVPAVAAAARRRFVGVELSPSNVEQFYSLVLPEVLQEFGTGIYAERAEPFADLIVRLRHAKFLRVLARSLKASGVSFAGIVATAEPRVPTDPDDTSIGHQALTVFIELPDHEAVRAAAEKILRRPPLSKFGIQIDLQVADLETWTEPSQAVTWSRIWLDHRSPTAFAPGARPASDEPLLLVNLAPADLAVGA
jgi:DNA modification methylase